MNFVIEYHQPAFAFLHEHLHERSNEVILTKPASIRSKYLTEHLPIGEEIAPHLAWKVARELLDVLEVEMAAILRNRSVFFWLHVYRRIGVFLHPFHEDKTDPRTLALVRQIAELAIFKHGHATDAKEIVLSSRVNPDLILGGFMRVGVKWLATKRPSEAYRNFAKRVKSRPQWVIRDFSEDDFLGIYYVEGLAYQYWRLTALLRSLGKGARIIINDDGDWDYVPNDELTWLLESIDARTEKGGLDNSLLGIWIDKKVTEDEKRNQQAFDLIICPVYNVYGVKLAKAFSVLGLSLFEDFSSNFVPALLNVRRFLEAHDFLSDAFQASVGYRLEAFVSVLWAISNIVHFPDNYLLAQTEEARSKIFRDEMFSVLQRGYAVYNFDAKKLTPNLRRRLELFAPSLKVSNDEIQAILDRVTLSAHTQGSISLWSGGPQHVLIHAGQHQGVFLQGLPIMLATMFFRIAHNQGQRGTVFEDAFRRALSNRDFQLRCGPLKAFAGEKRELDAGVVTGEVLYAFECVSVERPLDYEIGNVTTFSRRRERLDDKVTQVLTLADFLRANPLGTNYDFTQVREIVPLVVSPFEEWIWDRSERLWLADGIPRILSASEALDLLVEARRKSQCTSITAMDRDQSPSLDK